MAIAKRPRTAGCESPISWRCIAQGLQYDPSDFLTQAPWWRQSARSAFPGQVLSTYTSTNANASVNWTVGVGLSSNRCCPGDEGHESGVDESGLHFWAGCSGMMSGLEENSEFWLAFIYNNDLLARERLDHARWRCARSCLVAPFHPLGSCRLRITSHPLLCPERKAMHPSN